MIANFYNQICQTLTSSSFLLAQTDANLGWHAKSLGEAVFHTGIFCLVGLVGVFVGFKIFDRLMTKIDLEKEIHQGNVAAAILGGAAILAIAIIIAASILG
jgi:uncharacterized membrane protein YjfL (UPF0719 family)